MFDVMKPEGQTRLCVVAEAGQVREVTAREVPVAKAGAAEAPVEKVDSEELAKEVGSAIEEELSGASK